MPWTFAFGTYIPDAVDLRSQAEVPEPAAAVDADAGGGGRESEHGDGRGNRGIRGRRMVWGETFALGVAVWLFVRMALNAIDGMMARELGQKSRLGAILNEVGDVVSDAVLYGPLALLTDPWPVIVFVFGAALTEFCGVLMQALDGVRRYEGPMGKSDRAFAVGLLALVTALWPALRDYWPPVFWILASMTLVTCIQRCRARKA